MIQANQIPVVNEGAQKVEQQKEERADPSNVVTDNTGSSQKSFGDVHDEYDDEEEEEEDDYEDDIDGDESGYFGDEHPMPHIPLHDDQSKKPMIPDKKTLEHYLDRLNATIDDQQQHIKELEEEVSIMKQKYEKLNELKDTLEMAAGENQLQKQKETIATINELVA
eukprot:CAMPEP_0117427956 /NCGR_PEP_ID=MMETSP0758-20121206/7746_1 /TAXON_ID=63605 /ORGANISM="Percolomonas cosmopolitus, Strain AE-1 (ATCC 50343)" /LENGTH=165 /DNA_ID=CAMNT_0005213995 /DNA_START=159 /DNA_END=652 /DNA_ORIENTATION=-